MIRVVEIKQELNDTSFEQEIFDISKLSRHIVSMLDIAKEINYNNYKFISSLTPKILKIIDVNKIEGARVPVKDRRIIDAIIRAENNIGYEEVPYWLRNRAKEAVFLKLLKKYCLYI